MARKSRTKYEATLARAALAIGCGGLAGGVATAVIGGIVNLLSRAGQVPDARLAMMSQLWFWPAIGLAYALLFTLLLVLVSPLWWWLHRRGVRQWWAAPLIGAGITLLVMGVILWIAMAKTVTEFGLLNSPAIWIGFAIPVAGAMVVGALMALIMWRVAYRRAPGATDVAAAF